MKIDKSLGNWSENSTYIDDVAYSIFVEKLEFKYRIKNSYISHTYTPQDVFIYNKYNSYIKFYYIKANNLIRKEKLQKINENR